MKHVAIIDNLNSTEEFGKYLNGKFTFALADCKNSFFAVVAKKSPDAVVINADYEGDSLLEIIACIRGIDLLGNIPIILFTRENDVEQQEILCSLGADDVIILPLSRELIVRRISVLITAYPFNSKYSGSDNVVKFDDLINSVSEKRLGKGALCVHKNDFANIYRFIIRRLDRDNKSVQVLLFTLNSRNSEECAGDDIMNILADAVKMCLRRGDISSICSKNQVAILLLDANDDGGHLVANRILSSFYSECDDETYELNYDIREINVRDTKTKAIS